MRIQIPCWTRIFPSGDVSTVGGLFSGSPPAFTNLKNIFTMPENLSIDELIKLLEEYRKKFGGETYTNIKGVEPLDPSGTEARVIHIS